MKTFNLTATGNQPGTYLWSNGMSGATITVDHGGPYQVTFMPEGGGCEAIKLYNAPKSPDVYSWIFPTGCFSYCKGHDTYPYLIGPIPYFNGYAYEIGNTPVSSGLGIVPDLVFANNINGPLSLTLSNAWCQFTKGILNIALVDCPNCDVMVKIIETQKIEEYGFVYYKITSDYIENPYNYPITVTLSSDYGVFVPASVTIPANSYWFFASNPVDFIPNQPLAGSIPVAYTVEGVIPGHPNEIVCEGYTHVDFMGLSGFSGGGMVQMTVMPNPAESATRVQYIIENQPEFDGGIIKLYSLSGQLIGSQKVNETQGQARFDLSSLPAGTYVVVFFSHSQRLGQQVLIKE